ncbi:MULTISPECIES: hypothetical protein [unclassified Bradyrhizobium]|uniref:hypothetical protein n=1 Tax=unclassified Bradyrhizobium TaxID=2631580 RepID=UPI002FF3CFEA
MTPSISFVCAVESGPLEVQTVRLAESLRRWGGVFSGAPIFAITPRAGPKLSSDTLAAFDRLAVTYIRDCRPQRYLWFKFLNKPLALVAAEEHINTDTIAWLDSDILIVNEPSLFHLKDGEDFAACASTKEMGTSGEGDEFDALWQTNCRAVGIDVDHLPWITTERERIRIRLYWNGGVIVYRRATGFSKRYLEMCNRLMDARNKTNASGFSIGINEMSAIGLAMHEMGLRWRALPYSHNYNIGSRTYPTWYSEEELRDARVVHYHDSMWPWFWDTFVDLLKATHPAVAVWLSSLGPMRNDSSVASRIRRKLHRLYCDHKEQKYIRSCSTV